jgi:hypothetical protein
MAQFQKKNIVARSQMLAISEFLDAWHIHMFQKRAERN